MTPGRRWGTPTRCLCCDGCPLTSIICDAWQRQQWLSCPFFDVVLPRLTRSSSATTAIYVPNSIIYSSVSWQQTWPNHDNLWYLTVDSRSSWRLARTLTCCHAYSVYVLCMICQASSCNVCFQLLWLTSLIYCSDARLCQMHTKRDLLNRLDTKSFQTVCSYCRRLKSMIWTMDPFTRNEWLSARCTSLLPLPWPKV